jgi:murein DD-endopeptidase MepM/ murein hydrolase activator NlpD
VTSVSSRGSWDWPTAAPHALARGYLAPATPYAAGHRGIDIRVPESSTVFAPDDGVVHFAGVVVDRPVLSLDHGGGTLSSFEPVQTELVEGDEVVRGQPIGTVLPGHCRSSCLHVGARVDGEYVNPLLFLGGMPWSVLIPP